MVRIVDQEEAVLILAGYVLPEITDSSDKSFQFQLAKESVATVPGKLREFFSYMTTPRFRADVYLAISNAGGNISDVDQMISQGLIRVVSPGHNDASLDSLAGLRLVPLGYKVDHPHLDGEESIVYVGNSAEATKVCAISALLASVLWDDEDAEDFPSTVRRLGLEAGWRSDVAIRLALSDLDGLLAHGLARWDNLLEAQIQPQKAVIKQTSVLEPSASGTFLKIKKFFQRK